MVPNRYGTAWKCRVLDTAPFRYSHCIQLAKQTETGTDQPDTT
jgi:hypothetical protein